MVAPKKAPTPKKAAGGEDLLAAIDAVEVVNSPVMGAKFPKAYTGKLLMLRKALKKGPRHG